MKPILGSFILLFFLHSSVLATALQVYQIFSEEKVELLNSIASDIEDFSSEENQDSEKESEGSEGEEKESEDTDEKEYYSESSSFNCYQQYLSAIEIYHLPFDYSVVLQITVQPPQNC